ncbi:18587_t:CDS:1, partial [Racocetra persica]
ITQFITLILTMLKNLGYENTEANPPPRSENVETHANLEPKNAVAKTQNIATEQFLNDGQDDQSICEVILSDQEDEKTSDNMYSP